MSGILIKSKEIRGKNGVRSIFKYLDESDKLGMDVIHGADFSVSKSLEGTAVNVHGFLTEFVHGKTSFSTRDRLTGWWSKRTADMEVKGVHLIFALSDDFSERLKQGGIPPAHVLEQCIVRSFSAFERQFEPEDSIGFVTGFHDEKDHKHVHCLVFPFTQMGKRLNLSQFSAKREEGKTLRRDYLGFLQAKFETEVEVWGNCVSPQSIETDPSQILAVVHAAYSDSSLTEPEDLCSGVKTALSASNLPQVIADFPALISTEMEEIEYAEDALDLVKSLDQRMSQSSPLPLPGVTDEITYAQVLSARVSRTVMDIDAAVSDRPPAYLPQGKHEDSTITPLDRLFALFEINRELMAHGRRTFPLPLLDERDIGSAQTRKRNLAQYRMGAMLASEATPYDKIVVQRSDAGIIIKSPGFNPIGSFKNLDFPNWGNSNTSGPSTYEITP